MCMVHVYPYTNCCSIDRMCCTVSPPEVNCNNCGQDCGLEDGLDHRLEYACTICGISAKLQSFCLRVESTRNWLKEYNVCTDTGSTKVLCMAKLTWSVIWQ